jgi:hypothetical protein
MMALVPTMRTATGELFYEHRRVTLDSMAYVMRERRAHFDEEKEWWAEWDRTWENFGLFLSWMSHTVALMGFDRSSDVGIAVHCHELMMQGLD